MISRSSGADQEGDENRQRYQTDAACNCTPEVDDPLHRRLIAVSSNVKHHADWRTPGAQVSTPSSASSGPSRRGEGAAQSGAGCRCFNMADGEEQRDELPVLRPEDPVLLR